MKLFGYELRREQRDSIENPTVPVSSERLLAFFGVNSAVLPAVTVETALQVPAVNAAVNFLSRSLACLPLHPYRKTKDGSERLSGKVETILHENPNPYMDSFKFRQYFWQQIFTVGRGLAYIERNATQVESLWPMDPNKVTISRKGFAIVYSYEGRDYSAEDVLDVPYMLRPDMLSSYGPITLGTRAIQLALAMNDYGSQFFAGGGVPPLALVGPLPQGAEAMKRAMGEVHRAIDTAKKSDKPLFPLPPGHDLKPVGFDPAKGQMVDARRFQTEEIARVYQLPPVFLQDLSRATFSNVEQQDLHLVKHLIGQWAAALEGEMNLKIFGRFNNSRFVEHNLDGLMRGDFVSRMAGLAQSIQNAILTPNEARELENRPALPHGDELLIQGATMPLGTDPAAAAPPNDGGPNGPGKADPNAPA